MQVGLAKRNPTNRLKNETLMVRPFDRLRDRKLMIRQAQGSQAHDSTGSGIASS